MPRGPRIEVPGGTYHLGSRGNNREAIVGDDEERDLFVWMLNETASRHRWTLLSYVLMTNHYHLVVRIRDGGLSDGMQLLNSWFAHAINVRQARVGHLFQNRFYSELVESDGHLLELVRYLDLNPVRAGVCRRPEEWRYGSYRACAGLDHPPAALAVGELLGLFGARPDVARASYRRFVSEGHVQGSGSAPEV